MTEYWKSLPRKYCKLCDSWFADNKISVQHHERGVKHQSNVKRRLDEARRTTDRQVDIDKDLQRTMASIDASAKAAFAKDVRQGTARATQSTPTLSLSAGLSCRRTAPSSAKTAIVPVPQSAPRPPSPGQPPPPVEPDWHQKRAEDGSVYYENLRTHATQREAPDRFLSIPELERRAIVGERSSSEWALESSASVAKWTIVDKKSEAKKEIDLRLPEKKRSTTESAIERLTEKILADDSDMPQLPLERKRCAEPSSGGGGAATGFKRRNVNAGSRKLNAKSGPLGS